MGILLVFHQAYQPVGGSILLSALVAGLPLYVLFVMLAVLRLPAWICALAAMLTAAVLGWLVWGMPLGITVGAATEGMAFGLWPISWIVLNAVFFHNLTVASGDFDVIKRSLTRLTEDRRLQTLLVAFSFGALLEGIAGFGAPVAITASILASLGFEPVTAAVLALLANTAPVAFGSIGIPVVTLGGLVAPILGHTDPTQHHAGALGDGRPPAAALLDPHPRLPDRRPGRLAANARDPARGAAHGHLVRGRPVPGLQLRRPRADRHPRRAGLDGLPGAAAARLEAGAGVPLRGRGRDHADRQPRHAR